MHSNRIEDVGSTSAKWLLDQLKVCNAAVLGGSGRGVLALTIAAVLVGAVLTIESSGSAARAQDGIPDNHPAEPLPYLDQNATAFFGPIPANFRDAPTFEVRIVKLIDRSECFSDSFGADHPSAKGSASWFAEAEIISRKNTTYFPPTIKLCPKANWLDKFHLGETGIVIAYSIKGDPYGYMVPYVQTYREMIQRRRDAGGWCLWTYCIRGKVGF